MLALFWATGCVRCSPPTLLLAWYQATSSRLPSSRSVLAMRRGAPSGPIGCARQAYSHCASVGKRSGPSPSTRSAAFSRKIPTSSTFTFSTGRSADGNSLGFFPITVSHMAWVHGVSPSQKPRVIATSCTGPSSSSWPGSSSGEPIMNLPFGIQRIRCVTPSMVNPANTPYGSSPHSDAHAGGSPCAIGWLMALPSVAAGPEPAVPSGPLSAVFFLPEPVDLPSVAAGPVPAVPPGPVPAVPPGPVPAVPSGPLPAVFFLPGPVDLETVAAGPVPAVPPGPVPAVPPGPVPAVFFLPGPVDLETVAAGPVPAVPPGPVPAVHPGPVPAVPSGPLPAVFFLPETVAAGPVPAVHPGPVPAVPSPGTPRTDEGTDGGEPSRRRPPPYRHTAARSDVRRRTIEARRTGRRPGQETAIQPRPALGPHESPGCSSGCRGGSRCGTPRARCVRSSSTTRRG